VENENCSFLVQTKKCTLEEKMSAFVIVDVEILDPERYETYKTMVPDTVSKYGGRFLARGGSVEALEGGWSPQRLVILEFPSNEQAKAWYDSVEYAPAKALRHQTAWSRMVLVEGVK
jgi:uncharacterized protein (DUF1330 family)